MDEDEVVRLIELARKSGLDPGKVLQCRLASEAHMANRKPRKSIPIPDGFLTVYGICQKYGVYNVYVKKLRDAGLPSKIDGRRVLIREADYIEWVKNG